MKEYVYADNAATTQVDKMPLRGTPKKLYKRQGKLLLPALELHQMKFSLLLGEQKAIIGLLKVLQCPAG